MEASVISDYNVEKWVVEVTGKADKIGVAIIYNRCDEIAKLFNITEKEYRAAARQYGARCLSVRLHRNRHAKYRMAFKSRAEALKFISAWINPRILLLTLMEGGNY